MSDFPLRIFACGMISTGSIALGADDEKKEAEKFVSISPDKKFAMRIVYDEALTEGKRIPGTAFHSMALVTWPEKKFVVALLPEDEGGLNFGWSDLLWSGDSRWVAFHYSFPRFGYTRVYRRDGETFKLAMEEQGFSAPVKGDIRNQYVEPVRWLKPGTLLLDQTTICRGDEEGEGSTRFQATWVPKAKEFRIATLKK